ncbi:PIG-L family deacetylase [Amycolatopsis antarctica]|uniref:PIG-L family deacetylase n=1 Tax=Amycolatopsis antarctica TaxID=1854586 RepID=A0A263D415_9PSEU|nr:PIG-L family deacetylase [Amycolatopsis antarctica]OZM72095.1 PIG-L family deacetylase [Amycolatopsis antarctica]
MTASQARNLDGPGTPEQDWQAWPGLRELPVVDPRTAAGAGYPWADVVVVAPHPDDEVLGIGGTMALLAGAGVRITLISVTDGEASHPGSPTLSPDDLRRLRVDERENALAVLGLADIEVVRLRVPDGEVIEHENHVEHVLRDRLRPDSLCLAPWHHDGHPDHDATGRAALAAAEPHACRLLAYPVWMWHWAEPGGTAVPWSTMRAVPLGDELAAAKRAAAAEFATQVGPLSAAAGDKAVLPGHILRRLLRDFEVVLA